MPSPKTLAKQYLDCTVYEAALARLRAIFAAFPRCYVSFSGGKDSGVLLHLALQVATEHDRLPLPVLCIDMEAQYGHTIAFIERMLRRADIEPYWICLPLHLRNAVSQYQSHWLCWDGAAREAWVRPLPDGRGVISDPETLPFFRRGMEFEEFVPAFGEWFSHGQPTACLVAIRKAGAS